VSDDVETLEARIAELEAEVGKLKRQPKHWTDVLKAVGPLISGVVVLFVGYLLTGSVNLALQEKQLQVSNVKEMREMLLSFDDTTASLDKMKATAVTLSAFGGFAVGPLLNLLDSGSSNKVLAAKEGLRAVGIIEPEAACEKLAGVLGNRTRLFSWETHLWVIRLAGQLSCEKLAEPLAAYEELLEQSEGNDDLAPYSKTVRRTPPLAKRDLLTLGKAIDESRELLAQASREQAR
jgi:hypothetical protein